MSVDVVALSAKFVELRIAKKPEAMDMLCEKVEWEIPTLFSSETHKGKKAVVKFFKEQDEGDMPTIKKETPFEVDGKNAATRTMTVSKFMIKVTVKQTFYFSDDGKLTKGVTIKM